MTKEWTDREKWGSARKKVWEAVNVLIGDGPIEKRLAYACVYLSHLYADKAAVKAMPAEAQGLMEEIMEKMRAHRAGGERDYGTVELHGEEGGKLAEAVLSLYTTLNDGI